MAHVARSVFLSASADTVWSTIGGFQSLGDWHPAVASVAREDLVGVEHRRIAVKGGGEIFEKLLGTDGRSYAYEIIESPLPVLGYRSSLSVIEAGSGSVASWVSTFEGTADGAEVAVAGIYEGGFAALKERFGA